MHIKTLIPDIYDIVRRKDGWLTDELSAEFSARTAKHVQASLSEERGPPRLRLSAMGPRCPRALWFSQHQPELAEQLQPWAEIKFAYGHMVEALAITLAKASGHEVTGEQDELVVDGVYGHRDCVIDGCVVDVKSSTSFGMGKFRDGSIVTSDTFGYLAQLDGYVVASLQDPLVRVKDRGYNLVIDKTLGHMVLYEHIIRESDIRATIAEYKRIVDLDVPPPCECGTTPFGKSGNIKLDTRASYNNFKYACHPNLRTFIYSDGPVYLTKVVRPPSPDIMEMDRHGKMVFR